MSTASAEMLFNRRVIVQSDRPDLVWPVYAEKVGAWVISGRLLKLSELDDLYESASVEADKRRGLLPPEE